MKVGGFIAIDEIWVNLSSIGLIFLPAIRLYHDQPVAEMQRQQLYAGHISLTTK
jgi:hypothetical protein